MVSVSIKNTRSYAKNMVVLSILAGLLGILTLLVSDVFALAASPLFAVVFLFDRRKYRPIGCALTAGFLLLSVAVTVYAGLVYALSTFSALLIGFLLFLCFSRGVRKADTVLFLTVLIALFFLLSLLFAAGTLSVSEAYAFYTDLLSGLKDDFLSEMSSVLTLYGEDSYVAVTTEQAELIFNAVIRMLVCVLVIISFVTCGVVCKIFTGISRRMAQDERPVLCWQFSVSSVFAYFYLLLFFFNIFVGNEDIFGITVINLYGIFLFVFGYIGLKFAMIAISHMQNRLFPILLLACACLFLSAFALQILSFFGVFFTIMSQKYIKKQNGGGDDGNL